jgi:preprotein translocase subunit SecD
MRLRLWITAIAVTLMVGNVAMAEPLTLAIAKATMVPVPASGEFALNLQLTQESEQAFAAFTTANVGKVVDLSIDGAVVMSPRLMEPTTGGEIMVGGTFAPGELERIVEKISSGGVGVTVDVKAEQPGG